jgi:hypothetical protein
MMLMANCKFLMHFNTADRINNRHMTLCKNPTYLLFTKSDDMILFLQKMKIFRYLDKLDAYTPELEIKSVVYLTVG